MRKLTETYAWFVAVDFIIACMVIAMRTMMFVGLYRKILMLPFNLPEFSFLHLALMFNIIYYLHPIHYTGKAE